LIDLNKAELKRVSEGGAFTFCN